jgi:hypothetical protein
MVVRSAGNKWGKKRLSLSTEGDAMRPVTIAAVISLMSPTIAIAKDCYRHHRHCHQESALGSAYSVIAGEKRDKILPLLLLWRIGGLDFLRRYNCQSDLIT